MTKKQNPYPQYEVCELEIVSPYGASAGWSIKHMETGELVTVLDHEDPHFPWFASSRKCALAYVRFLNCIVHDKPLCLCD